MSTSSATFYRYPKTERPADPADAALLWIAENGRPDAGLVQAAIETSERHGDPLGDNPMRAALLTLADVPVWGRYPHARSEHGWRPAYISPDGSCYVAPDLGGPWRQATASERAAFQPRAAAHQNTVGRIFDDSLYLISDEN